MKNKTPLIILIALLLTGLTFVENNKGDNAEDISEIDSCHINIIPPFLHRNIWYKFKVEGVNPDDITFKTKNMQIDTSQDGFYRFLIGDSLSKGTISIHKKNHAGNKIFSSEIKAMDLPFVASINRTPSGSSMYDLQFKSGYMFAEFLLYGERRIEFPVDSFDMVFTLNDTLYTVESKSWKITEEQYKFIKKMHHMQPLIFKNIFIKGAEGSIKSLKPIVYFVDKSLD